MSELIFLFMLSYGSYAAAMCMGMQSDAMPSVERQNSPTKLIGTDISLCKATLALLVTEWGYDKCK